ncbi:MAG: bifunctional chorismate mutase/prephenate dehydratase [Christensenellales bacterium]|jgi:chorismate mutase/prephenate dehydratase
MNHKEALADIRRQIDEVDEKLIPLLEKRMEIAGLAAQIKRENNLSIMDTSREQQVIERAAQGVKEEFRMSLNMAMRTLLALSRAHQHKLLMPHKRLISSPRAPKTDDIVCAYQGVPGSWSEQALERTFPGARRLPVEYFDDVFRCVKDGGADYGIVPIENSRTGAIGETYDLLRRNGCFVVGRVEQDIRQCLLAPKGVKLSDISRVLSHPEALKQCGRFLREGGWDQVACRNTAVAAQEIAQENDGISAAIASPKAAELNGLEILAEDIADSKGNRTSFVIIATEPEYDESCERILATFATEHRSGALCETLMSLQAQNINLTRIESRPGGQGRYRFFVEVEGNIMDDSVKNALEQAADTCTYFEVMGCYRCI